MLSVYIDLEESSTAAPILLLLAVIHPTQQQLSLHQLTRSIDFTPPLRDLSETSRTAFKHCMRRIARLLTSGQKTGGQYVHLHPSFHSFLVNLKGILSLEVHKEIAFMCLSIMAKELRFNICHLPSSFLRNSYVVNRAAVVEANISSHLRYACHFWTFHLSRLETCRVELVHMISDFFHIHLLSWLEVMSITETSPRGALAQLQNSKVSHNWCSRHTRFSC